MTSMASVGYVCVRAASRHGPRAVRSLRTGMITDTRGRIVTAASPPVERSAGRGATEFAGGRTLSAPLGEDLDELFDVLVPVEAIEDDLASPPGHGAPRLGIAHEALDGGGQRLGVLLGDEGP